MVIVTPSRWLAECVRSSSLFSGQPVEVIPYGLDTHFYKPMDKNAARERWNLPKDKKLVLFGAMQATSEKRKGFQYLKPALDALAIPGGRGELELVIVGASQPTDPPDLALKTHFIGQLHDDASLALLYSAVDVFILPSTQDNLPNTVLEALACGTPVVAFDIGGVPDMIDHHVNGYLAKAQDPLDLARGIEWVLKDSRRNVGLGKAARKKAVTHYALEIQANRYRKLYEKVLGI